MATANWWEGLQPQLDPEKITVGLMADMARRGALSSVVKMIGMDGVDAPDADEIETMANLMVAIAQQQRPGITFEDVLGMPFSVMVRLFGLHEPPEASAVPIAVPSPPSPPQGHTAAVVANAEPSPA